MIASCTCDTSCVYCRATLTGVVKTSAADLVARFTAAFVSGRVDVLSVLLASDCSDGDPSHPPGRDGVVLRAAAFHARFAGAASTLADVRDEGNGRVVADWISRVDGELVRWHARFEVAGNQIIRFDVARVAL